MAFAKPIRLIAKTSVDVVHRAIEFYASIGKKPIHLQKEVVGHVANRLQAAIYREVVNPINPGVVDVADADTAVCRGPGLRWGIMGPGMLFHLAGGQGGIQHFMEHLSGPVDELALMRDEVLPQMGMCHA